MEKPMGGRFNIHTLNGSMVSMVKDGVLYCLVDCDNLTALADRKLYFAAVRGKGGLSDLHIGKKAGEKNAYIYDGKTGEFARNENYNRIEKFVLFVFFISCYNSITMITERIKMKGG